MKKYTELSNGKWIVSGENSTIGENGIVGENGTNEFLLVPRMKGIVTSTQPALICDCNEVITSWNGSGFVVILPATNTTHTFTLSWGGLTRTFQLIVSNRDLQTEITQLQNEKLVFDNYAVNQNTQFKNFISSIENDVYRRIVSANLNVKESIERSFTSIHNLNQYVKDVIGMYENSATTNAEHLGNQINAYPHMAPVYNAMISVFSDQASKFKYIRTDVIASVESQVNEIGISVIETVSSITTDTVNNISAFVYNEKNNLNDRDIELANLRSQQANIVPIDLQPDDVKGTMGPVCTWDNITSSLSDFNNNVNESFNYTQLQQDNANQSLLIQQQQKTLRRILNGDSLFQLTSHPYKPGVYYYGLNQEYTLPENLTLSVGYYLIGGRAGDQIRWKCPMVWVDESGNEVIRNFICEYSTDRSHLVITNQDNEIFGVDNSLMYTTTGKYETGTIGTFADVQSGYTPVRLKGEGFFGICVTVSIGNSYKHSEVIPVCISGKSEYQPVGGVVENLDEKISDSGQPIMDNAD